jgi:hypothetical protein
LGHTNCAAGNGFAKLSIFIYGYQKDSGAIMAGAVSLYLGCRFHMEATDETLRQIDKNESVLYGSRPTDHWDAAL